MYEKTLKVGLDIELLIHQWGRIFYKWFNLIIYVTSVLIQEALQQHISPLNLKYQIILILFWIIIHKLDHRNILDQVMEKGL